MPMAVGFDQRCVQLISLETRLITLEMYFFSIGIATYHIRNAFPNTGNAFPNLRNSFPKTMIAVPETKNARPVCFNPFRLFESRTSGFRYFTNGKTYCTSVISAISPSFSIGIFPMRIFLSLSATISKPKILSFSTAGDFSKD